jgi:Asparagine synthase (glutamine-hydrolyzing)
MSAIFGIINKNGKPVEQYNVNAILSAIAHRATDGKDTWLSDNVALGHCLLKVYPQQVYEHCPLTAYNCIITADARLDNRNELAALLEIDRSVLDKTSDPEIILQAYKRWGENCTSYLEGEFAFAIWDTDNQKLFAATDHIGFRPFFYYDSPEQFIFCSEIKGVVAAKPCPNYFNEESLIEYFYRKGTPNITYNKEVFALCGGNVLTIREGKMAYRKYWNLESTGKYNFKKDEDWYDCTRELLYRAVEKRLNPDVPTGITLSGGLDSTSIACILSELLMKKNKPLYAFSSVLPLDYKGIEKDERHYIEIVGKHCPNIIQTYVEAPGVGPFSDLEEAFKIEETFPNTFFYMDKALLDAAATKNVRSLFSGFGGDFWISWKGDTVIYELMKSRRFFEALVLMNRLGKEENKSFYSIARSSCLGHSSTFKYLKQKAGLSKNDEIGSSLLEIKPISTDIRPRKYNSQMQNLVNRGQIGRITGMLANRNSNMLSDSLTPLFDKNLLTLLSDMPLALHLKNGKRRSVLRETVKGIVPESIYIRKDKMAFSPDYKKRILSEVEYYEKVIESIINDKISRQYMNISNVIEILNVPLHGCVNSKFDNTVYTKIAHVAIAQKLMGELKKYGYCFDTTN